MNSPGMTAATLSIRRAVSLCLLVADAAVGVMTVAGLHGPLRLALGLLFALAIPGWAVVGPLRLGHEALEVGLTLAVSLALLMFAAQVLLTVHAWDLTRLEEVACLACAPSLAWQGLRPSPAPTSGAAEVAEVSP